MTLAKSRGWLGYSQRGGMASMALCVLRIGVSSSGSFGHPTDVHKSLLPVAAAASVALLMFAL